MSATTERAGGICHQRAADTPAAPGRRRREERLDVDRAIQSLQSGGDFPHALDARGTLSLQEPLEGDVLGLEKIAQDVNVAAGVHSRHLAAVVGGLPR